MFPHLRPRKSSTRSLQKLDNRKSPLPVVITASGANQNAERALRLSDGSCIVGAGQDADLLVNDETISRSHVRLSVVPEGVLVEDLNSRNGTYYLGHRIVSMIVSPGTTIMLGSTALRIELDQLPNEVSQCPDRYGDMVAESAAMRQLFATLQRLEGSLVSVLIQGESGTGKELIARAIHENSRVSNGPFVAVNCGALQANLVRSELFGHKKGAFTGAVKDNLGAFQEADGGTLFLDEMGDLPADVQPMLLRALEERAVTPVGSNKPIPVSVRLIAASHKNLEQLTRQGTFREDLYYRLMVVKLMIPSLRERTEDIRLLATHFAGLTPGGSIPEEKLEALLHHDWPGNVRELRHAVDCFLAVGELPQHSPSEAPPESLRQDVLSVGIDCGAPYHEQKEIVLREFTRQYLAGLLEKCGQNVSQASRASGLERSYLNKLTKKLGLRL